LLLVISSNKSNGAAGIKRPVFIFCLNTGVIPQSKEHKFEEVKLRGGVVLNKQSSGTRETNAPLD
jgi:hypothetical protein